jgi:putative ABC transport system permease protein
VFQLIDSPIELLNDKLMFVSLDFAQSLFDTKGVDRISVLLKNTAQTERVRQLVADALKRQGLQVEVRTWQELAPSYGKVKDMFTMIFGFIFVIVFVIVVMSVVNTVGVAILERTREIGTLRTLGVKRSGIVLLFMAESGLLGLFGCGLGVIFSAISQLAVRLLEPTWIPPGITRAIPLEIRIIPGYLLLSLVFLVTLSLLAAIMPAWRAARRPIVEALAHV